MSKATQNAEIRRIKKFLAKWIKPLGLEHWRIHLETDIEDAPGYEGALGVCRASWQYQHATIFFQLARCTVESDTEMEEHVVHELVHVLLKEIQCPCDAYDMDHEERVCTHITRAFLRVGK